MRQFRLQNRTEQKKPGINLYCRVVLYSGLRNGDKREKAPVGPFPVMKSLSSDIYSPIYNRKTKLLHLPQNLSRMMSV